MNSQKFLEVLDGTIVKVGHVLNNKSVEYASDDDRLKNFRTASHLQKVCMQKALGGMMAKHTVSIYDMIDSCGVDSLEKWDEKIIDHINYLILLRAIVIEGMENDPGF